MASTGGKAGIELVQKLMAQRVSQGGIDKLFMDKVMEFSFCLSISLYHHMII